MPCIRGKRCGENDTASPRLRQNKYNRVLETQEGTSALSGLSFAFPKLTRSSLASLQVRHRQVCQPLHRAVSAVVAIVAESIAREDMRRLTDCRTRRKCLFSPETLPTVSCLDSFPLVQAEELLRVPLRAYLLDQRRNVTAQW